MKISKTLDAKRLSCPLPILKTKKAIGGIGIGEYLEVLATDPGSEADFQAWARSTGNEVVEHTVDNGTYRYVIKRNK
ncbi:MAG: sulfurtransferase TusA family protein [Candidatus Heimdallarchaeota archaeon]|nr:sulfurtransferase TusA family protein [Candidatus Heimdallarchaeota archaeon]